MMSIYSNIQKRDLNAVLIKNFNIFPGTSKYLLHCSMNFGCRVFKRLLLTESGENVVNYIQKQGLQAIYKLTK